MKLAKSLNYAIHAGVLLLSLAACTVASQNARAQLLTEALLWTQVQPSQLWQNSSVPTGWSVRPCEGDGPFLCVYATGNFVGSIEIAVYPLETLPRVQSLLSTAEQSTHPEQTRRLAVLNTWVQDYYTFFQTQRRVEYGESVAIESQEPVIVKVGQLPGLQYDVQVIDDVQQVKEVQVGYVSLEDDSLIVVHTAFDPASVTATFDSLEHLTQFKPYLTQLVANLQLPLRS